ncbi:hypothetical protein J421_3965 [Gemmatirosa kalamazoonensis]|uniref:Transmembrane protein n=1 Tax=Gemmatirosa kalamazoonensis TaxID=861299 RepID=W0RM17_9BACT|nr:hypothetical protein [Gemmatirosa kalamazoonensis]AHG91502.1 hypothetical protein J421_3965 [Gemmatirosa kalamazoonensis]
MRLELLPLIFGVVVALGGLALVFDSRVPDSELRVAERRRRARTERDRAGEGLIGVGIAALGAALIGRDAWAYGNIAVLAGVVCLAVGSWRNRQYLRELLFFRGAARRGRSADRPTDAPPPPPPPSAPLR